MELHSKVIFKTVDNCLSALPGKQKELMQSIRKTIKIVAPEAIELLSYNMPAFKVHGRILLYYAAHKAHIGFYPGDSKTIEVFKEELVKFNTSKGTVQFPLDKKLPLGLIKKIVKYRVKTNLEKKALKGKK